MRKYIYDAIKTKSKAAMRLKANGNVYDACKAASPIHKVSAMQKHKKEKDQGKQYYHYHPMLK